MTKRFAVLIAAAVLATSCGTAEEQGGVEAAPNDIAGLSGWLPDYLVPIEKKSAVERAVEQAQAAAAVKAAEEAAAAAAAAEAARRAAAEAAAAERAERAAEPPAPVPDPPAPKAAPAPLVEVGGSGGSAYTGPHYHAEQDAIRQCIVRKESGGNYGVVSPGGTYHGAYQFLPSTSDAVAKRMGRPDLVGTPASRWSRADQDQAFWTLWGGGAGRSNWPTARGC